MPAAILVQTRIDQYVAKRRAVTETDIQLCGGSKRKLLALRSNRTELAKIYAEDGAITTATLIEVHDIAMINEAINAL